MAERELRQIGRIASEAFLIAAPAAVGYFAGDGLGNLIANGCYFVQGTIPFYNNITNGVGDLFNTASPLMGAGAGIGAIFYVNSLRR